MTRILDRFPIALSQFHPKTVGEMFAFRLAQKLGEKGAVHHYISLLDAYSEAHLLYAYRRALRGGGRADMGRRFHVELERTHSNGYHDGQSSLLAIRIERRAVAAAVFNGTHLEYADSRQLASTRDRALASSVGFINWMLDRFPVESAALETIPTGQEIQRRALHDAICAELREHALPIWEVSRADLLDACAYSFAKSRADLRATAVSIWPILAGDRAKIFIQDAAILGLHVQIERLFMN